MRDNHGTGKRELWGGPPNGVARGVGTAPNLFCRREYRDCGPVRTVRECYGYAAPVSQKLPGAVLVTAHYLILEVVVGFA